MIPCFCLKTNYLQSEHRAIEVIDNNEKKMGRGTFYKIKCPMTKFSTIIPPAFLTTVIKAFYGIFVNMARLVNITSCL